MTALLPTIPSFRQAAASSQRARRLQTVCTKRMLVVHCPEEPRLCDPDSKPQHVAAAAILAPADPVKTCLTRYLQIVHGRLFKPKLSARRLK